MPLWVGISRKARGLGGSEKTKVRVKCVCRYAIFVTFVGLGGARR